VVQRLVVVGLVDFGPHPVHRLLHLAPARPRARACASAGTALAAGTSRRPRSRARPPWRRAAERAGERRHRARPVQAARSFTFLQAQLRPAHTPTAQLGGLGAPGLHARGPAQARRAGARRAARAKAGARMRGGAPHHSSSFCFSRARMTGTATAGFFFSRSTTWCPASPARARLRVSACEAGAPRPASEGGRAALCAHCVVSSRQRASFSAGRGRRDACRQRGARLCRARGAPGWAAGWAVTAGRWGRGGAGAAVRHPGWRRRCAGWRGSGWATACPPAAASSPSPPPPAPAPARGGVSTRRPNLEHAKQSGGQQHAR